MFDSQRCCPGCVLAWGASGEAELVGLEDVMGEGHPQGWQRRDLGLQKDKLVGIAQGTVRAP